MSLLLPFRQRSRRGVIKALAVASLTVAALSWAVPVAAQSLLGDLSRPSEDLYDNNLYVKWSQGSSQDDEFHFWGSESLKTSNGQRTASKVLAVFGVSSSESSVRPHEVTDEFDVDPPQLSGSVSRHLLNEGTEWKATIAVANLVAIAREAGFSSFSLELCPLVAMDVQSIDGYSDDGSCKDWTWSTTDSLTGANAISITEHPDKANFDNVVRQLALWVLAISVVTTGFAVLLQKLAMKELKIVNIVLSILCVIAASIAVTIAACAFGWGVQSVHDVLLVEEAGYETQALLIFLPSLLVSLPFLLPAIAFIWAKPRSAQGAVAGAGSVSKSGPKTGVPDWMIGNQPQPARSTPRSPEPSDPRSAPPDASHEYQPSSSVEPEKSLPQPPRWDPPA